MQKLSDLIKGRLDTHNLSASAKASEVLHKANILLADQLGQLNNGVKAYRFDGGTLFIAAENSVLCQELWGLKISLLNSLKKQFGKNIVKKILIKSLTIN